MLTSIKERVKERLHVPTLNGSLKNLIKLGYRPSVIYDIGAYSGEWTKAVRKLFPHANIVMFEAQNSKEDLLKTLASQDKKISYCLALLGASENEAIVFNEYETASSVLTEHHDTGARTVTKQMQTLDALMEKQNLPAPDFMKLDTQGYELEILKGGLKALNHAEVVLMEVSLIDIYKNCPLLKDVVVFMDEHNFQLYDISSLMRRPLDQALFQIDALFVRKTSKLLADKAWQ